MRSSCRQLTVCFSHRAALQPSLAASPSASACGSEIFRDRSLGPHASAPARGGTNGTPRRRAVVLPHGSSELRSRLWGESCDGRPAPGAKHALLWITRPRHVGSGGVHAKVRGHMRHLRSPVSERSASAPKHEATAQRPTLQETGLVDSNVEATWERTMDGLQDLITKRHREKLQTDSLEAMRDYLARLDLDVAKLPVIHVAGTKGKGSTCTMIESILRAKGYRTALYTSPHLMDVRERIRIDGMLLTKQDFSRYFWEVHEQLRQTADAPSSRFVAMPGYFRFLTLLAFKVFLSKDIDVAIIEVGLGGRLDATNVVTPLVCGITSLDYDHTNVLGDTLAQIAFEKAGILKSDVPSFTAPQQPEAQAVLHLRAAHVGSHLTVVPPLSDFTFESTLPVELGMEGEIQLTNCALAVSLVNAFLATRSLPSSSASSVSSSSPVPSSPGAPSNTDKNTNTSMFHMPDAYRAGLKNARMLARCQRFPWLPPHDPPPSSSQGAATQETEVMFYMDGAHTKDSLASGVRWAEQQFLSSAATSLLSRRLLVFYCSGDRDAEQLIEPLAALDQRLPFWHVAICGNNEPADTQGMSAEAWKATLASKWKSRSLISTSHLSSAPPLQGNGVSIFGSVALLTEWISAQAVADKQRSEGPLEVYVTGSLLLCGDLMSHLRAVARSP